MTTSNTGKAKLNPTKAPTLPFAPVQYDRQYQDALTNILRQYFNQNDNLNGSMLQGAGGKYLSLPHIAASDSTNQYAAANNTPTKVLWNTEDSNIGFTLHVDNTASTENAGIYKIDYSLQFANSDSQVHDVYVWLHVDGYDIAGSGSKFTVPSKHGAVNGFVVAYSSLTFVVPAGEKIALYWATDQAATSGGGTGVYMEYTAAQTSPFAMPSVPSAVGTIAFISRS